MKAGSRSAPATKWRPVPAGLRERFVAAVGRLPGVEVRQLFGCPAAFVHGNMFAGGHQETLLVRLPPDAVERAVQDDGCRRFEPMAGRPMREYVVLPPSVVADDAQLDRWLGRALAYSCELPPKPPEKAAKKRVAARAPRSSRTTSRPNSRKGGPAGRLA